MVSMQYFVVYQTLTIPYVIIPSARRKTIALIVHKKKGVCVRTPPSVDISTIQQWVETKKEWLAHIIRKEKIAQSTASNALEYLQYLGRKYPLIIHYGRKNSVVKKEDGFHITTKEPTQEYTQQVLTRWLRSKAKDIFLEVYQSCFTQFVEFCRVCKPNHNLWYGRYTFSLNELQKPILRIYAMKSRYGSLRQNGVLTLNLHLIHAPYECIEFVLFHELAHIIEFNHSPAFYAILASLCPQWKKYKTWLEEELIPLT